MLLINNDDDCESVQATVIVTMTITFIAIFYGGARFFIDTSFLILNVVFIRYSPISIVPLLSNDPFKIKFPVLI